MFCQGDFHYLQPKELAFCDSHCHASQSQKVTLRPRIILYAYKGATIYHPNVPRRKSPLRKVIALSLSFFFFGHTPGIFSDLQILNLSNIF